MTYLTKQETFDKVSTHLLTQNKRALNSVLSCVYLGTNGFKCAIGCLIPEELYNTDMEGRSISGLFSYFPKQMISCGLDIGDLYFLERLQKIHDNRIPERWYDELEAIAKVNGLKFNVERPTL